MHRRPLFAAFAFVGLAIAGIASQGPSQDSTGPDELVLKYAKVPSDTASLLKFFRDRTLKDEDCKTLEQLVQNLDSAAYEERTKAHDQLVARGPLAVPILKAALAKNLPLELKRRAQELVKKIEAVNSTDVIATAARLLAARNADGTIDVLLGYLPNVDDPWLEEEVLTSLGRLAVKHGRADPKLLAALKDPLPARRAAALYILGRRADVSHRALVRSHLADADAVVRERAAQGLVGKRALQSLLDNGPSDETVFKAHSAAMTDESLIAFLRKRTPDGAEQGRLAGLVAALASLEYRDRYLAAAELIKAETPALPFLKPALANPDAEVARRARLCLEDIRRANGPALPTAVVRRLAWPGQVKDVSAAIQALLAFIPFAEDESVEEEAVSALTLLSVRQETLEPGLSRALADALPARRSAAAYVLGAVGMAADVAAVRKLLDDPAPIVRLRAALGLLAARDKAAVPTLIAQLGELPPSNVWRVQETLNRLAGDDLPPDAASATATPAKAVKAWQKWWRAREATIDLARATEGDSFLGLITVCEYDNAIPGQFVGQIWEGPRHGPPRFKFTGPVGPMDVHVLPNGRVLVAENGANRVTERDRDGAVKWEFPVAGGNPVCCQRLANGNTFIAMYNQLIEVRPDKSEVYRFSPGPQFFIFYASKTRTGTVVCITNQNTILEVDPAANKTLRTINLGQPGGGWASVEQLPNGNFLVANSSNSTVREINEKGEAVWSFNNLPGVFRATRLPSGNYLTVSMNTKEVTELDRTGAVRWKHVCQGRPWSVHYR